MSENPILVEVHRGHCVESSHRGSAVAVDASGAVVFSLGHAGMVYPRSALKIFQAIPLVQSGAADHFNVTPAEIALTCASHNAEEFHVQAVTQWLQRLDLSVDDLECGPSMPLLERAGQALLARGEQPTRAHQNCSGKHAGMLTLAKFMGVDTHGYSEYDHPTQQAWMQTLSALIQQDVQALPWERDGCGLPAVCMPLEQLARAYAGYADTRKVTRTVTREVGAAMARIKDAVRAHPHMLGGTDRCCTDVIRISQGRVLIKTGAEGVYGGAIPHRGIGFALKIDDGASRAGEVALGALLHKLDALDALAPAQIAELQRHFQPQVVNTQNWVTGKIVPSANW